MWFPFLVLQTQQTGGIPLLSCSVTLAKKGTLFGKDHVLPPNAGSAYGGLQLRPPKLVEHHLSVVSKAMGSIRQGTADFGPFHLQGFHVEIPIF